MQLTGKNKVAILFSLLGPEISSDIIAKLRNEDAQIVRSEILKNIDNVEKPQDIDLFIDDLLTEIQLKNESNSQVKITEKIPEIKPKINYQELSDEEIMQVISYADFSKVIIDEAIGIQKYAISMFPIERIEEAKSYFIKSNEFKIEDFSIKENSFSPIVKEKIRAAIIDRIKNSLK